MSRFLSIISACMIVVCFAGCANETLQRFEAKPSAFGGSDKINVIADMSLWESNVQDTLDYYYGSAYIILPQPEPLFDIKHFTPQELRNKDVRRELRVYLMIANLEDANSETTAMLRKDIGEDNYAKAMKDPDFSTKVAKDRWASGQIVIYLWGRNKEELIRNLKRNFAGISKRIHKFDERQYESTVYFGGENVVAVNRITEKLGVRLRVPQDYTLALSDNSTVWLRRNTDKADLNILVHRLPYNDKSQLTKEGLKAIRDAVGKTYVSSTVPDSYMRINDVDLPLYVDPVTIDNKYALHGRGIWDIVNDYMGGSFVTYLIHDEEKGQLILIDGFVHAPGVNKRLFMQQLDYVLRTIKV